MNTTQKKFILKKLIPFILREQGRGFTMEDWINEYTPEDFEGTSRKIEFDGIERVIPKCNTVACIGGSIEVLTGKQVLKTQAAVLGLTEEQADALFYGWTGGCNSWPRKYQNMFAKAKTALGKAKVACKLLEEIVKTDGAVMVVNSLEEF